ncbi:helicase associated domain-containing protein [Streptomyces sp. NPDC006668]|uniref:helicase associated domain-containing protein n=1 Tax=Streptomyces sp. NPDC006668 TaxID=3156903 RepID=UPI0033CE1662
MFLGPDEDPNELLTSDAYNTLAKILGALRAHDSETIERLADPRVRSGRPWGAQEGEQGAESGELRDGAEEFEDDGLDAGMRVGTAAGVLRFSEERDPAALTQFVRLRVIDPEGTYWRRGIEAATRWLRETGNTELRVPYVYITPEDWGSVGSYPLGVFIADQRRYYAAGTLEAGRVAELEALGMVWSAQASAWEAGLAVAESYADTHGHFLPPTTAVWGGDGFPIGVWAKNQRASARKTRENAARREAGETGLSYAGELSQERMEALDAIDPGWAPEGWDVAWQRCYRLTLAHTRAGGTLPGQAGELIVQGEDLGAWITTQRAGWEQLTPAQRFLLESVGVEPADAGEVAVSGRHSQDERWAVNLAAARQFHTREGHLRVPRKHVETIRQGGGDNGGDGQETVVKLGAWIDNTRRRADRLSPQRRADLDELGMRW